MQSGCMRFCCVHTWHAPTSQRSIIGPCNTYICRILAPSTYILFTSAIPAIAFGEQFVQYTGKFHLAADMTHVSCLAVLEATLLSTAACGMQMGQYQLYRC